MWYVYEEGSSGPIPLAAERVKEIIAMNESKKFPEDLKDFSEIEAPKEEAYSNVVGQDSLTRFDRKKTKRKKKRKPRGKRPNQAQAKGKAGGNPKGGNKGRPGKKPSGQGPKASGKPNQGKRRSSGKRSNSNKK